MTDKALEVSHNPAAPQDERQDALREAQKDAMPSTVPNMTELVRYVAEQYQDQQFTKALSKPNVIPFPSRAIATGQPGMQSLYLDDTRVQMMGEWYEKNSAFSFDMMRTMVDQTPILSAVILTRQRQLRRFCRVSEGGKGPGFNIKSKDPSAKLGEAEKKSIVLLESFFTNCGWENNPRQRARLKRDNFSNFVAKLTRDSLTMDSAAIETEYKRDKSKGMDGMYAVDGATIRLCNEEGYQGDDELFALQVAQGQIRAAYTYDDLIYVPRNPRTDVMVGGYGMSETELLVKVVTGFLNAMTYNNKYFDSNAIPKGLLHLSGDYSQDDMSAFKRYWNSMVKGINNAWTLPVMVSKNQESKASFENFGVDVNEMMFSKWMTFLTSIICAIYGMAPDEINFESFTNGASSLSGSDTEEKLINSKDKGLRPLLSYFEDVFSDYVVAEFSDKYLFRWSGLDETDAKQQWDEETTLLTWGEARKVRGWDEIKDEVLNNAPLNQNLMGAYMQSIASSSEDYGNPDGGGDFGQDPKDQQDPKDENKSSNEEDPESKPDDKQDQEDDGDQMAKSFGLPIWKPEP
jgi:hypothetical protein